MGWTCDAGKAKRHTENLIHTGSNYKQQLRSAAETWTYKQDTVYNLYVSVKFNVRFVYIVHKNIDVLNHDTKAQKCSQKCMHFSVHFFPMSALDTEYDVKVCGLFAEWRKLTQTCCILKKTSPFLPRETLWTSLFHCLLVTTHTHRSYSHCMYTLYTQQVTHTEFIHCTLSSVKKRKILGDKTWFPWEQTKGSGDR